MRKKYISTFVVFFLFLPAILLFTCSQKIKFSSLGAQLSIEKSDDSVLSITVDEDSGNKLEASEESSAIKVRPSEIENLVMMGETEPRKPKIQNQTVGIRSQKPKNQIQAIDASQQTLGAQRLASDNSTPQEQEPFVPITENITIEKELQVTAEESEPFVTVLETSQEVEVFEEIKEVSEQVVAKQKAQDPFDAETYTIQLASYNNAMDAERQFNFLKEKLTDQQKHLLRIEYIKGYFTLRLGKFDTAVSAQNIIPTINDWHPSAFVLKAFIKDERIHQIIEPTIGVGNEMVAIKAGDVMEATQTEIEQPLKPTVQVDSLAIVEKEHYTIQIGSFRDEYDAARIFDSMSSFFEADELDSLRIEKVQGFHTVRLGRFNNRAALQELLKAVWVKYPNAFVLSAYLKKDRISRIFQTETGEADVAEPVSIARAEYKDVPVAEIISEISNEGELAGKTIEKELGPPTEEVFLLPEKAVGKVEKPNVAVEIEGEQQAPSIKQVESELAIQVMAILTADEQGEKIAYPGSVFTDSRSGEIFVIVGGDRSRTAVIYGPDYLPLVSLGPGRKITSPVGGFINPQGKLYMCQLANPDQPARLTIYNAAFFLEKEIVLDQLMENGSKKFSPKQIAASPDGERIYIAGPPAPGVMVLDSEGNFLHWLRPTKWMGNKKKVDKRRKGQDTIVDVFIDSAGDIYLLSEETGTVYIYNKSEEFQSTVGEKGGTYGKLSRPRGVAVDRIRGLIYVVDYLRHAVLVYNLAGKMLSELGGRGVAPAWVNFPTDLAVDSEGHLVVADFFNSRVQVWKIVETGVLSIKNE